MRNNPSTEASKCGSASSSVKSELQKIRKQLSEKNKELVKMRNESSAQVSEQNIMGEEHDKKAKQLST